MIVCGKRVELGFRSPPRLAHHINLDVVDAARVGCQNDEDVVGNLCVAAHDDHAKLLRAVRTLGAVDAHHAVAQGAHLGPVLGENAKLARTSGEDHARGLALVQELVGADDLAGKRIHAYFAALASPASLAAFSRTSSMVPA